MKGNQVSGTQRQRKRARHVSAHKRDRKQRQAGEESERTEMCGYREGEKGRGGGGYREEGG